MGGFCHDLPGINVMPGSRRALFVAASVQEVPGRCQGTQLLASWRTELTRRVGMVEVVPVSRVAVAPAPVAPAVPVAPLVAPVEGGAGEFDDVEGMARDLDLAVERTSGGRPDSRLPAGRTPRRTMTRSLRPKHFARVEVSHLRSSWHRSVRICDGAAPAATAPIPGFSSRVTHRQT